MNCLCDGFCDGIGKAECMLAVKTSTYPKIYDPYDLRLLEYSSPGDSRNDWALLLPPRQNTECVIVLHGHGATGDQLYRRQDLRNAWVHLLGRDGRAVLSPHLRGNAWMNPEAEQDLISLIGYMKEEDELERFILASCSMGGTGSLIFAMLHPDTIRGVIALCPATDLARYCGWCRSMTKDILHRIADAIETSYGGTPDARPRHYEAHSACAHYDRLDMPVFIGHGTADTLIPVSESRSLIAQMKGMSNVRYEEVPGGNHGSVAGKMAAGLEWIEGTRQA